ncbi:MAG: allophanate hydrolase-related protein [Microthrixaceae bacterium]
MIRIAVVGAHLSGQPLNHQLTDRGGRLVATTRTAPAYRLVALDTEPPKPGLLRTVTDGVADPDAGAVEVEVWELDEAGFGTFVDGVPAPLCIGTVELADGTTVKGFLCEEVATRGAPDITATGGWRAHLAGRTGDPSGR